ncbi:TetR/AcrR family transcriptional regulator [Enterococcus dispar]|jgi:AcrR family transcriptional regulator|uniref:TetR/AcrR family transcriptional regulator n=1 Tax=Enterococcus dispar TaxID=44009 RepID=UPI00189D65A0|nr:TetR/AcrR family transcriptional regulator [Enterococcus dispar]WCG33745.1 TetR/AcrR family transcriptional regulator [Enterococcus dispar]
MARKKTITRDQILNAAYDVVATDGFSRFTARNIAAKMKCSTQPIYLEFKNMEDLKMALIKKLHDYLATEVFPVEHTGEKIVDLALNYIGFATEHKRLYRAMYLEEYGGGKEMQEFSFQYFSNAVKSDSAFKNLSDSEIESLHTGCWIVATGIAALKSSGIINPTEEQVIALMRDTIKQIIERNEPLAINY